MRKLTVSKAFLYRNANYQIVEAPFMRLQGKWLEALGFTSGCKVEVLEKQGEITIRLLEGGCTYDTGQVHDESGRRIAEIGEGESRAMRHGWRERGH
ncbi:SymE family type I addiction module toxin [Paenibacillus ferrarius]|uniref:SymE family type I addiction module toxin n=1 Tax=Paenibacillus ferrarius TaxID=1469647 RepID=UPI0009A54701|nr:SymE family type I addiction module toxin [Paenibacillus ferrarius]